MAVKVVAKTSAEQQRDIEDANAELDEYSGDPLDFWSKKQRELVTAVVDYNLSTLADLINEQTIDLAPKYQRRSRWSAKKQSLLIESFLMNVPVPPIFLNEDELGQYSIIDGKQRLSAVYGFLSNNLRLSDLEVFSDINGMTFFELPRPLQTILRTRPTVRSIIILRQSDPDVKHEVFQRLNTGGEQLNPQEIRNNAYSGPLNDLVMELAESKEFHSALGIKNKDRSAIYREMRDAEFVLRFFTFKDIWTTFKGGMRRAMDGYMDENRRLDAAALDDLRRDFQHALSAVVTVFGDHPFQRWQPEKGVWRRQVLASLFDAQMFGLRGFSDLELLKTRRERIVDEFKGLFSDDGFRRSIDAATNTPTYFRDRIQVLTDVVDAAIQ